MEGHVQYPFKDDHDVFVALIQDFNTTIASINVGMREMKDDTAEIKKIVEKQYESLSERIGIVEKGLLALNPEELAALRKDVRESKQWISDFNTKKHIAWIIASTGFLIMGHYIGGLAPWLELIMRYIFSTN